MTLDLVPVLPELILAGAAMVAMMWGVFAKGDTTRDGFLIAVLAMVAAIVALGAVGGHRHLAFGGMFVLDRFAVFTKIMILLGAIFTAGMSIDYLSREKIGRFEYPVLVLFATLGMLMMVSANDFLSLYMGLELQSLSLYVLAAYHRDNARATEAGLKYFVLGALASGMLLYGVSLVYGFAGTTAFGPLAHLFAAPGSAGHIGVVVGLVFIVAGLAFKLAAVPFHMWTPDVYEGAPTPVTAFFAAAPKIAAMALFIRVLEGPFGLLFPEWQQVVIALSVASMVVGSFAAIAQTNIKRLMAYSSIGHVGFAMVGLAAGGAVGVQAVLVYLAIYLLMIVGTFAVILSMRRKGCMVDGIGDLAGLSKTSPSLAFVMAVLMFSMAGIPPMAGFWGKFYVFMAAVRNGLWPLAVVGVLASVVAAFYYLRIIKIMYFDEPAEGLDRPLGRPVTLVMVVATLGVLLLTFIPGPLLAGAKMAALALFPAAG
jgi:NADH-quinone oxidoreductase subunit N